MIFVYAEGRASDDSALPVPGRSCHPEDNGSLGSFKEFVVPDDAASLDSANDADADAVAPCSPRPVCSQT